MDRKQGNNYVHPGAEEKKRGVEKSGACCGEGEAVEAGKWLHL